MADGDELPSADCIDLLVGRWDQRQIERQHLCC